MIPRTSARERYSLQAKGSSIAARIVFLFTMVLMTTNSWTLLLLVESFSNNQNANSPWKTASWQIVLNIGREESSKLPEDWGKSGARLSFPVELEIESDVLPEQQQDALLGGRGSNRISIVNPEKITYINDQGEQTVPFQSKAGGWKLRLGKQKGHASLLRFWLDVGATESNSGTKKIVAQEKDVTLEAGERLYFAAHCWRESEWRMGQKKLLPFLDAYERAQQKLEEQVSHESGDRRLDGTDTLETLAAYKDMAGLTLDRDDKRQKFLQAQEYLPPPGTLPLGNWPGSTELLAIKPMEVFVQRKQGPLAATEYHLLGSWTAKPLEVIPEEEEYEYYYEDDDDDEEEEEEGVEYYYEDGDKSGIIKEGK